MPHRLRRARVVARDHLQRRCARRLSRSRRGSTSRAEGEAQHPRTCHSVATRRGAGFRGDGDVSRLERAVRRALPSLELRYRRELARRIAGAGRSSLLAGNSFLAARRPLLVDAIWPAIGGMRRTAQRRLQVARGLAGCRAGRGRRLGAQPPGGQREFSRLDMHSGSRDTPRRCRRCIRRGAGRAPFRPCWR